MCDHILGAYAEYEEGRRPRRPNLSARVTERLGAPSLGAFVVCYGPGPDAVSIARIRAKGLGVYAENDARINAGLGDVDAAVRTYHKTYRYAVYPGVGHGFLRTREKPEVADSAWKAVVGFFRESLER